MHSRQRSRRRDRLVSPLASLPCNRRVSRVLSRLGSPQVNLQVNPLYNQAGSLAGSQVVSLLLNLLVVHLGSLQEARVVNQVVCQAQTLLDNPRSSPLDSQLPNRRAPPVSQVHNLRVNLQGSRQASLLENQQDSQQKSQRANLQENLHLSQLRSQRSRQGSLRDSHLRHQQHCRRLARRSPTSCKRAGGTNCRTVLETLELKIKILFLGM